MKVLFTAVMCCVVSGTALGQQAPSSPTKPAASSDSATAAKAPASQSTPTQAAPSTTTVTVPTAKPPAEKAPEHPCTEAQVREYLTETGGDQAAHIIMLNMARSSRQAAPPYFPAAFWDEMQGAFEKTDLIPVFLPAYQQHISEEEMAAVLAFYKTPAGKHFLDDQPVMASEAQRMLAQQGREIGHDIYLKYKDQIEEGKKQFEAQHGSTNGGAPAPARRPSLAPGTAPTKVAPATSTTSPASAPSTSTAPAPSSPTPDSSAAPK
jgi:uncharacterized protein